MEGEELLCPPPPAPGGRSVLTSSRQGVRKTQHTLKKPSMWLHQGGHQQIMSTMSLQNRFTPAGTRQRVTASRCLPPAASTPTMPCAGAEPCWQRWCWVLDNPPRCGGVKELSTAAPYRTWPRLAMSPRTAQAQQRGSQGLPQAIIPLQQHPRASSTPRAPGTGSSVAGGHPLRSP